MSTSEQPARSPIVSAAFESLLQNLQAPIVSYRSFVVRYVYCILVVAQKIGDFVVRPENYENMPIFRTQSETTLKLIA